MRALLQLASALTATDFPAAVKRGKRATFVYGVAGVLFLTAYIFALVAGYRMLSANEGAVAAAILIAAGTAFLGAVALVALAIADRAEKRAARRRRALREMQLATALSSLSVVGKSPLILAAGLGALAYFTMGGSDDDAE